MLKPNFSPRQRTPRVSGINSNRTQRHLVSPYHSYKPQILTRDPDYRIAKEAEASLYAETKRAEAVKAQAQANFFAKQKEAEGTTEMAKAYGHMADALGGPQLYIPLPHSKHPSQY